MWETEASRDGAYFSSGWIDGWMGMLRAQQFLDVLGGDEEEHASLLACYLLYLGLEVYLVHGMCTILVLV